MNAAKWSSRAWVALLAALLACSNSVDRSCLVHADCASGVCAADGQCAPADASEGDGSEDVKALFGDGGGVAQTDTAEDAGKPANKDAAAVDGGSPVDSQSPAQDSGPTGVCKPNHDGTIDAHEAPYGAGLEATYRIATNADVQSAGEKQTDGSRVWDFGKAFSGDHDTKLKTLPVAGTWYDKHFPGATYAARLLEGELLLGVFEVTDKALLLRGVVSPNGGLLATRLSYKPPVEILAFPLAQGQTWTRKASVTGFANGIIATITETYTSTVDAHGIAKTPFGNFPVLRVSTVLDRQVGLMSTRTRTQLFATECFGTVASLRSHDGETKVDFKNAAEVRRLTP